MNMRRHACNVSVLLLSALVLMWGLAACSSPPPTEPPAAEEAGDGMNPAVSPVQGDTQSADEGGGRESAPVTPENAVELQRASAPDGEIAHTVDLGGGVKLDLVWIPPGSFMMGSPESEEGRGGDETQHQVEITRGFWMGKHEVTQAQWGSVMGSNPSGFKGADRPVEFVSWDDCQLFLQRLNSRVSGGGFRLPTEAEWEYACRAGTTPRYSFGNSDGDLHRYGNYCERSNTDNFAWQDKDHNDGHDKTAPVGSFLPNGWGLHDMHGNVWEWCQDWYGDYPGGAVRDPEGLSSGSYRVFRGGSWFYDPRLCRSAYRYCFTPGYWDYRLGFRLVLSPVR